MLPGTHNAGSYSVKDTDDVVTAWVVCQDEDIISQLLYGIRCVGILFREAVCASRVSWSAVHVFWLLINVSCARRDSLCHCGCCAGLLFSL